ncbi:hypothetical protein RhiirB3_436407 [Rhizophagus irregularis]|nr:hypothetical protein RhiirB3_436407 [Rhizophagus irregularis]
MPQLTADCLDEIFEHLADDEFTLRSCILVNRLWCKVSIRILWRNAWNYNFSDFRTLIACLPSESKKILSNNRIMISTPTLEIPTFDYASFCNILPVKRTYKMLELLIGKQIGNHSISPQNLFIKAHITTQEVFKMFMNQITSLKILDYLHYQEIGFTSYPGARNCLKYLSELYCSSDTSSDFFYQLSQICNNISLLDITIVDRLPHGLINLISVQQSLKCLNLSIYYVPTDLSLLLTRVPNTLTKLRLYGGSDDISLSFIIRLTNLQELQLSYEVKEWFKDFEILQYTIFPKLQVLKFKFELPNWELLVNFLEHNGKNLEEIYFCDYSMGYNNNSLNLSIARYCPILKNLSTGIESNELETLKIIFESCHNLKSIKVWCGGPFINEKDALEVILEYSKNIDEIILYYHYDAQIEIFPEELDSIFINWSNHIPQKSISLILITDTCIVSSLDKNYKNLEIIEKYIDLGIIKKFEITDYEDLEYI